MTAEKERPDHEGFTPTERRILILLEDGEPHLRSEIHKCCYDDLTPESSVKKHVSNIRKKLRNRGEDVKCVLHLGRLHYVHVVLLRRNHV